MSGVSRRSIVQWSETPVATAVGEEVVLMNLPRGRCYGLGEVGTEIWKHMARPIEVNALILDLSETYAADPAVLAADVLEALAEYAAEGLIDVRNPERPESKA